MLGFDDLQNLGTKRRMEREREIEGFRPHLATRANPGATHRVTNCVGIQHTEISLF